MSKDTLLSNGFNIWKISKIKLPYEIKSCTCLITEQSTLKPKLIVLGPSCKENMSLKYNLWDIIGYHTFIRFTENLTTVMKN